MTNERLFQLIASQKGRKIENCLLLMSCQKRNTDAGYDFNWTDTDALSLSRFIRSASLLHQLLLLFDIRRQKRKIETNESSTCWFEWNEKILTLWRQRRTCLCRIRAIVHRARSPQLVQWLPLCNKFLVKKWNLLGECRRLGRYFPF